MNKKVESVIPKKGSKKELSQAIHTKISEAISTFGQTGNKKLEGKIRKASKLIAEEIHKLSKKKTATKAAPAKIPVVKKKAAIKPKSVKK